MNKKYNKTILVSGLSGAGMTLALKYLEDMGYDVFDNFPLTMVSSLLQDFSKTSSLIAIGIDTRSRKFNSDDILETVKQFGTTLVFLTADEHVLQKRFSKTRRFHPMARDCSVSDGIKKEQSMLHNLKAEADLIIDTTELTVHDLRHVMENYFLPEHQNKIMITLISFGFHWGLPREADIVMDVRFLRNPYWVTDLKLLDGRDQAVASYIEQDKNVAPFLQKYKGMLDQLLPLYIHEGKKYLTIAFGCSGGKHRSVFIVEKLKPWLMENQDFSTKVYHRDIERPIG